MTIERNSIYGKLFARYRSSIVSIGIIFVGIILLSRVTMPQIEDFFLTRTEEEATRQRIQAIETNIQFVSTLSDTDLDTNLETAVAYLPSEKEYASIINAITVSSGKANIGVDDFGFRVGELSAKSGLVVKRPSIEVGLSLKAGMTGAKKFVTALSQIFPLSEVISVDVSDRTSRITVLFYYRVFPPLTFDKTIPLTPLSQKNIQILDELTVWKKASSL